MATRAIAAQAMGLAFDRDAGQAAERNLVLLQAQQRARRGPTPEVLFFKRLDNTRLVKTEDPVRAREMRIFAGAMAVLFLVLMVYGWQHFSAIEYGYHVASERQQRDLLLEQNRQLQLNQAELCDPGRIDRMAHQLGLSAPAPGQVVHPQPLFDKGAPALAEASPALPHLR